MSTVLSYNADKFKILISDTRITKYSNDGSVYTDDSGLKIHYIDTCGFLAGAGVGELMMNTFNEIKKSKFKSLQNSFEIAYEATTKECDNNVKNLIKKTAVIVSTNDDIYLFSNDLKSFLGFDTVFIHKNKLSIQFPFDISETEQENILSSEEFFLPEAAIDDVLLVMLKKFKKVSSMSKYVSGICSIAILASEIESPFFTQKSADEILEIITKDGFVGLNNEFAQYKTQLISWDHI